MRVFKPIAGIAALLMITWSLKHQGFGETLGVAHAHAESPLESVMDVIAILATLVTSTLYFLSHIVMSLLRFLLDPNFILEINNTVDGTDPSNGLLITIWRLARDLVNIVFAFLLLTGGVVTVVSANTELIKTYAVKFIIAVILVNFSWFFPRVILDVSNVLTATIYQIPDMVPGGLTCQIKDDEGEPKDCEIITDWRFFEAPESTDGWTPLLSGNIWVQMQPLTGEHLRTPFGMLNGLVINHAKLTNLIKVIDTRGPPSLEPRSVAAVGDLFRFILHIFWVLVLQIAMFLVLIAMFVVFLLRIPILWLTIAFMPFMCIGIVIGDKMGEFNPWEKIWKKFLGVAFLPAAVAIPLTVGFVMINAASNAPVPDAFASLDVTTMPLLKEVRTLWQLLWMMLTVVVLWIGVFAAFGVDDTLGKWTEGIKNFGQTLLSAALKWPLTSPIIPMPAALGGGDDGKVSLLGLGKLPGRLDSALSRAGQADFSNLGQDGDTGGVTEQVNNIAIDQKVDIGNLVAELGDADPADRRAKAQELSNALNAQGVNLSLDAVRAIESDAAFQTGDLSNEQMQNIQEAIEELRTPDDDDT